MDRYLNVCTMRGFVTPLSRQRGVLYVCFITIKFWCILLRFHIWDFIYRFKSETWNVFMTDV